MTTFSDPPRRRSRRGSGPARREVSLGVYLRLRDLIVDGRLAPGAPLIETTLARRLNASRTPVRGALQRLQQEGFVAAAAVAAGKRQRSIVAPLTAADMAEVCQMTGALEAAAARIAAGADKPRRTAMAEELTGLQDAVRQAASARPPDLARAQALHARFHRVLAAGAGPRLRAELAVLHPQAERYERVYAGAILQAFEEAVAEHDRVLEALRSGDADEAEAAVSGHWRATARRYRDVVTLLGERGSW